MATPVSCSCSSSDRTYVQHASEMRQYDPMMRKVKRIVFI